MKKVLIVFAAYELAVGAASMWVQYQQSNTPSIVASVANLPSVASMLGTSGMIDVAIGGGILLFKHKL